MTEECEPTLVDTLVFEVHHLADFVDRSEENRPDLTLLMHRVQVVAKASTEHDQRRLHDALAVLESAIRRAMDRLSDRLKAGGVQRHALAAYGSLRPYRSAQNARSRA